MNDKTKLRIERITSAGTVAHAFADPYGGDVSKLRNAVREAALWRDEGAEVVDVPGGVEVRRYGGDWRGILKAEIVNYGTGKWW